MYKTQIVSAFAEKAGITIKDASMYFNALMGVLADNIVEGDGVISIPDFWAFLYQACSGTPGCQSCNR